MLSQHINNQFINLSNSIPPKFIRRNDLTLAVRTTLIFDAYMAQIECHWGKITELSKQDNVSRTFIYDALSNFKEEMGRLFFPTQQSNATIPTQAVIDSCIVSQRFEGRCSIDAIATIMARWDMPNCSIGSISQFLTHVGNSLPNTLHNPPEETQLIIFANDEIFACVIADTDYS